MAQSNQVKENHCPFGCETEKLDEHGYCHHLVGFTNDKKVFEPVQDLINPFTGNSTGLKHVVGNNKLKGKKNVQNIKKTDKLVNPEFKQLDNGAWHTAKKWVSDRVYREDAPTEEERQLQRELAELESEEVAEPVAALKEAT